MTSPVTFNTPDRVIREAMENAGLLQDGDDPSSEQFAKYGNRLNSLINYYQTQGLKLWLLEDLSITLTAGVNFYSLGLTGTVSMTKPLRALQGYFADNSSPPVRRPIYPMSWQEWLTLSQTGQQGAISQYFVDKQQLTLNVYFWLTPDSTAALGTAHLLIQQQVTNFTGTTDTMNFPLEWFNLLSWGLANEIATGQPQAIMDRCERNAMKYQMALENWDVEDASTRMVPDSQLAGMQASNFR